MRVALSGEMLNSRHLFEAHVFDVAYKISPIKWDKCEIVYMKVDGLLLPESIAPRNGTVASDVWLSLFDCHLRILLTK